MHKASTYTVFFVFMLDLFILLSFQTLVFGTEPEILVLIAPVDPAMADTIQARNISVYYWTDDFVVAGIVPKDHDLLDLRPVTILDRNPWSDNGAYFFATYWPEKTDKQPAAPELTVLYRHDRLFFIKIPTDLIEAVSLQGWKLVNINHSRKNFSPRIMTVERSVDHFPFPPIIDTMVELLKMIPFYTTLQTLEDFDTRYTYSTNINLAADWLYNTFQSFDLDVQRHDFQISSLTRQNIIATKIGSVFPDEIVVISGHYDSISENPYVFAPGADDNGTGATAVVEVARVLSQYDFERTIIFACFAGEEQGLYGSLAYVEDLYEAGANVIADVNLDMIGYSGIDPAPPDLVIYTDYYSINIAEKLEEAVEYYVPFEVEPIIVHQALSASDHAAFWQYGYQAILGIEDEAWGDDFSPYYHTTSDLVQNCDLNYALNCTRASLAAVADLAVPVTQHDVPSLGFWAIGLLLLLLSGTLIVHPRPL
ncbi:M20/M25/M40 family metallo-hydrolase [bacterium]|nr:M20/M25/M40 family metallo-hydrolase [bacterium]